MVQDAFESPQESATAFQRPIQVERHKHEVERLVRNRHGQEIPEKYSCAADLLELLAQGPFVLDATRDVALEKLIPQLSPAGVVFSVNENANSAKGMSADEYDRAGVEWVLEQERVVRATLPVAEIRQQLTDGKGYAWDTLRHLGSIYAQPFQQYSRLSFTQVGGTAVVVHVGNATYDLTFDVDNEDCRLREVHYLVNPEPVHGRAVGP